MIFISHGIITIIIARPDFRRRESYIFNAGRPVQTGCELSAQAEEAVSMFSFGDNLRGSADYRKSLAEIYVRRLMEQLSGEEA